MSLNIKNERTHALVRELAEATGLSQTSAVEQAVERWLHELRRDERAAQAHALLEEIWATVTDDDRAAVRRELDEMYDENGLPR